MKFIKNYRLDEEFNEITVPGQKYQIGDPQPTETHSVFELREMGVNGIYEMEPRDFTNPWRYCNVTVQEAMKNEEW